MPSAGFPRAALRFLRELGENNNREWFHAHRDEYETLLLEPARDFVVETGEELRAIGADVHADPRVNGSIFRINRDTRFSKDKRPYKDHLDLWFWEGEGPSRQCPGYWFRLAPDQLILGAGKHQLEDLPAYREAVADDDRGEALRRAVEQVARPAANSAGATTSVSRPATTSQRSAKTCCCTTASTRTTSSPCRPRCTRPSSHASAPSAGAP
jgi:uncharacterized protein (TIGR02453 family)